MIAARTLSLYDSEMRADPPPETGVRHEREGRVVRAVGAFNCILFSDLSAANADAAIAEQAAFFRAIGAEVEWKVFGHDRPADLDQRLAAAGFEPDEPETLMAFDLTGGPPPGRVPAGIEIRRVADTASLEDLVAVSHAAFGRDDRWMIDAYGHRLRDPTLSLYVAYADGRPVSAARLELPPGRSFAALYGGSTLQDYRGRGIYRALVSIRAQEARRRGYRYLTVDARNTNRPTLERLGFIALTSISGWKLKPQNSSQ